MSWKVHKFAVPIHSTDAEARACFEGVKRTIKFRKFLEHLGQVQSSPTPTYIDNEPVINLIKANRITSRLRHIDIPLCFMHNECRKETFGPHYCKSQALLSDFLTKSLTGNLLLRQSSWNMGHCHIQFLTNEHLKLLTSRAPISSLKEYLQKHTTEKS